MKHLCITYHMNRNWGTVIEPRMETAETCIVLPMKDDIAEDILEKGADSKHVSFMGLVYLALSRISEMQDYHYAGFCTAEEVVLTENGYIPVEQENSTQRHCEPEKGPFNPFYDSKFLFRKIGETDGRMPIEMYEDDLCLLRDEVNGIYNQRKNGTPGRGVYDPELEAIFAVSCEADRPEDSSYRLLAKTSDETLLEILKEVQCVLDRFRKNQGVTDAV